MMHARPLFSPFFFFGRVSDDPAVFLVNTVLLCYYRPMRRSNHTILLLFFVVLFLSLPLSSQAASKASYVFQHGQSREYIFEQTMNILKEYNFFILDYSSEKGKIEI